MSSLKNNFKTLLCYLLPALHLFACVWIQVAGVISGWEHLITIDFPFSIILVGLTWRFDHPLLWFGVLGTLWWYLLSFIIMHFKKIIALT
jgi:hypothetical protein